MLNTRILKMYEQPFYVRLLRNVVPNCHQVSQNHAHAMNSGQIKLLMEVFGEL
jgi:transketolase C-terminal domain/subunit